MSSPIGRSNSAAQAASSPTRARSSPRGRSGSVSVGKSARAAPAHVAYSRSQPSIAAGSPVAACSDAAVRSRSSASTSRPRAGSAGSGVYEEIRRRRSWICSPSSSTIDCGSRLTRYA